MNFLEDLNKEQLAPVLQTEGAVLVTAGAGSGKTRLLTYRICHLITNKGVSPYNILAVTFTNKATNEMRHRIQKQAEGGENVFVSTFHSFCVRFLRRYIEKLEGYSANFSIYTDQEQTKIIKAVAEGKNLTDEELKTIGWHIGNMKNQNLSYDEYKNEIEYLPRADKIILALKEYDSILKSNNALDFDDLLTKTEEIMRSFPEIRESFRERFKYISVDEFQDTNLVQYQIIKHLAYPDGNILVVGDEDQCIYGWRGAKLTNLLHFKNDFKNAKIFKLEQNYRSSKNIIMLANRLIKNNTERFDKVLFTQNEDGRLPVYHAAGTESSEADFVSTEIYRLVSSGQYQYSDIAVLMRLNSLSRSFEERFLNYNIPYQLYGGFKFFERAEIKNVLSYLRFVVNPLDREAFSRLVAFPKKKIGETSLQNFFNYAQQKNYTILQALESLESSGLTKLARSKFSEIKTLVFNMLALEKELPIDEFVVRVIKMSNIKEAYQENTEENINRKLNIDSLISSISEFVKLSPNATLATYLESVTLSSDIDSMSEDNKSVALATVHAVKGLEFKVVFVVGLENGIFPISRARNSAHEMEEERRLMYVAITRAKELLYLTRSISRYMYGKRDENLPSPYLSELGFVYSTVNQPFKREERTSTESKIMQIKAIVQKDFSAYEVGKKVLHTKFGIGLIIAMSVGQNSHTATVDFGKLGVKNLMLEYAPLQILKE